jgi:predicted alpha/beta-fold hydrolase
MVLFNLFTSSLVTFLTYCFIKWQLYTKSKVHFSPTLKNETIIHKLGNLDFIPTFFLPHFILQLLCNEFKKRPIIKYQREYLISEDGGLISLDWVVKENHNHDKLLIILHGLTGGSNTCYIRDTVEGFINTGYKIVVIQYRGINDTPLFTPMIFHGGFTNDLLFSLRHIRKLNKHLPCYCIGVSMGANIFTKLLVTHSEELQDIKGFVSISNPYCYTEVEKRNTGTWMEYLMVMLKQRFLQQHKTLLGLNQSTLT